MTPTFATARDAGRHASSHGRWRAHLSIAMFGLAMLAAQAATPTPLYPAYAERWDLAPVVISVVFATYVAGLALALVVGGSLSDHVGRRPVGLAALLCATVALAVLATADDAGALIVGRALQGVASGFGFASFGAALIDHAPPARQPFFAMFNGALLALATGLGAVLSAAVLEWQQMSFQASYLVQGTGLTLALLATLALPERHPRRSGAWRSLRPSIVIPRPTRSAFLRSAAALCAAWSLVGLYLGIGPMVTSTVLGITTPVASALAILSASGTGGVASILTVRLPARHAVLLGSTCLAVAAALIGVAAELEDPVVYFCASTLGGFGFGTSFQGGLRMTAAVTPLESRAGVLAALYLVSYAAFGLPTIVGGLLVPQIGLSAVLSAYAGLVASLAVVGLVLNSRPQPRAAESDLPVAPPAPPA